MAPPGICTKKGRDAIRKSGKSNGAILRLRAEETEGSEAAPRLSIKSGVNVDSFGLSQEDGDKVKAQP